MVALNYFEYAQGQFLDRDLNAVFRNCVVSGTLDNEIFLDKRTASGYNITLQNCLLKAKDAASYNTATTQTSLLLNTDPQFADADKMDFHPQSTSPLKNAGTPLPEPDLQNDLDEVPRAGQWDIGCYRVN